MKTARAEAAAQVVRLGALRESGTLATTDSLLTAVRATASDCFYYICQLSRGLSNKVSGGGIGVQVDRQLRRSQFDLLNFRYWPRLCKNTKPISQISILAILDQQICAESNHNRLDHLVFRSKTRRHEFLHNLGRQLPDEVSPSLA
jgi:hypothetical protein